MSVRLRLAARVDAGELARLRHALYDEQRRAPEPFGAYTERFSGFVHDAIASDAWRIWVAEVDDRVVGDLAVNTIEAAG